MMKKKTSEPFDLGSVDTAKGQESYPENQNSREAELVSRSPSQQGGRQGDLHENLTGANLTGASGPIEGELKVPDRSIIAPGEVLATGMGYLPALGTYRSGNDIRASRLGMLKVEGKVLKVIPMSGRYLPKRGDTLVAQVKDILMSGWLLDTNSAYQAMLQVKDATSSFIEKGADLTQYFALGDYIVTKIINVTTQKLVDVTMRGPGLRKLQGGRLIEVNTYKVPRIIGKHGSMVSMIKDATGCKVVVGQNGWVWIEGESHMENIVLEAIRKIEAEGHIAGLTERMKSFLEKKTNKKITIRAADDTEMQESSSSFDGERGQYNRYDRGRGGGGGYGGDRGYRSGGSGGRGGYQRPWREFRHDSGSRDQQGGGGDRRESGGSEGSGGGYRDRGFSDRGPERRDNRSNFRPGSIQSRR